MKEGKFIKIVPKATSKSPQKENLIKNGFKSSQKKEILFKTTLKGPKYRNFRKNAFSDT